MSCPLCKHLSRIFSFELGSNFFIIPWQKKREYVGRLSMRSLSILDINSVVYAGDFVGSRVRLSLIKIVKVLLSWKKIPKIIAQGVGRDVAPPVVLVVVLGPVVVPQETWKPAPWEGTKNQEVYVDLLQRIRFAFRNGQNLIFSNLTFVGSGTSLWSSLTVGRLEKIS